MTRDEADVVVALLSSRWPMSPESIGAWLDRVEPLDFDLAVEAARVLVGSDRRYAPLADDFVVQYDAARRRASQGTSPEEPSDTAPVEQVDEPTSAAIDAGEDALFFASRSDLNRYRVGQLRATVAAADQTNPSAFPRTAPGAAGGGHDARTCKTCLSKADPEGAFRVPTPNQNDLVAADVAAGDPAVPEPPSDYDT